MKLEEVGFEEFFGTIKDLQWQNQDIKESWDLGYKSPEDAFDKANTAWARFYLVKHRKDVLSATIEQRDGNLVYFTTTNLPKYNIRRYVKIMRTLSNKIIKCRDVLFVDVASWYVEAKKFLRLTGFRPYHITARYEVWCKDGKQN
jgi:hypothetical protein